MMIARYLNAKIIRFKLPHSISRSKILLKIMAHYQKSLILLSLQPGKIEEEEFQNYCKINQLKVF